MYTSLKRRSVLPGGGGDGGGPRASSQYLNISKSDLEECATGQEKPASSTPYSSLVKGDAYRENNNTAVYSSLRENNNTAVYSSLRENNNTASYNLPRENNNTTTVCSSLREPNGPSSYPQSPRDPVSSFGRETTATYSSFRDSPVTRDVRRQLKVPEAGPAASRPGGEDGGLELASGLGSKAGKPPAFFYSLEQRVKNSPQRNDYFAKEAC